VPGLIHMQALGGVLGIMQGTKSTDLSARKGIHTGTEGKPDLSLGRDGGPHLARLRELEVLRLAKRRWK